MTRYRDLLKALENKTETATTAELVEAYWNERLELVRAIRQPGIDAVPHWEDGADTDIGELFVECPACGLAGDCVICFMRMNHA